MTTSFKKTEYQTGGGVGLNCNECRQYGTHYTAMVRLLTELPLAKSLEDLERLAEIILSPNSQA